MAPVPARTRALVLPLALGLACTHARSSQARSEPSAQERAAAAASNPDVSPQSPEPLAGHSDDEMVAGRVLRVTPESVSIETEEGTEQTLQIVPETFVTIDGEVASAHEIQQGQDVRASYHAQDGRDVAVQISCRRPTDER